MVVTALSLVIVGQGSLSVSRTKTVPEIRPLAFAAAPSGSKVVATCEDRSVRIIDAATGGTVKVLGSHPQSAYAVAWSRDGKWIATGDETARIFIWNVTNGTKVREYRTHTRGIQKLSFDPTGKTLISTGKDDVIQMYNLASAAAKETRKIPSGGLNWYSATFNPKGGNIMVGTLSTSVKVLSSAGAPVRDFAGHGGQGMLDLDFSPSGGMAATGGKDNNVQLWSPSAGSLGLLRGHQEWVTNVRFSPNGRYIASGSVDRTVRVWDTVSKSSVATLDNESVIGSLVCWTADGKYLLTTNDADALQVNSVSPAQPGSAGKPAGTGKTKKRKRG